MNKQQPGSSRRKRLARVALGLLLVLSLLIAILVVNTFRVAPSSLPTGHAPTLTPSDSALAHLQRVVGFETVSYDQATPADSTRFRALHHYLARTYPLIEQHLRREVVSGLSLLYHWQGTNSALPPIILLAHQDVVPIEAGTEAQWQVPPFAGVIREGAIWGRGTTDNKANLTAIFEATEHLLAQGFVPARSVYFVFGHDEEIGGLRGAKAVAALLKQRGVQADYVLDEGGFVTTDRIPGLTGQPVALVGTSEKGFLSLELRVTRVGGHSSMPEAETAIDVLARAITSLRSQPFPADLSPSMQGFATELGPYMPFVQRLAFANQWLLKPLILRTYEKTGAGNASIRTTIAPTILHSGVKDNVVPGVATATLNFRIIPGSSVAATLAHVRKVLADETIELKVVGFTSEPASTTPYHTAAYDSLAHHVQATVPHVVVAPFLMVGVTDSRHFSGVSKNIFKFSPMTDPVGFHGVNEHLSLKSYGQCIQFYGQVLGAAR